MNWITVVPILIAALALLVSLGGVVVAIRATKISKNSHNHTLEVEERMNRREFEMHRSEMLNLISDGQRKLGRLVTDLTVARDNFEAESIYIKEALKDHAIIFTELFPKVKKYIADLEDVRNEIKVLPYETPIPVLMKAKAELYHKSKKKIEMPYETGNMLVKAFRSQLKYEKQKNFQ